MNIVLRVFLTVMAGLVACGLMNALTSLVFPSQASTPLNVLLLALRLAVAFWAGRLMWRRPISPSATPGLGRSIAEGALLVGGIGFLSGFFGPMIFAPQSNQGPMLGIFITGPLGVILGGIGGGLWWNSRRKRNPT